MPDIGADLDLLTCANEERVIQVMRERFNITIEPRSWSDRVAHKLNFRLPGLPELVEIHFGRLGQAGELVKLADRIMQRRVTQEFAGKTFWVPAPEERILLVTLQRLYRHFYMRICDVVTVADLVDGNMIDFDELRRAAKRAGVWPGVATLLQVVSDYMKHYRGDASDTAATRTAHCALRHGEGVSLRGLSAPPVVSPGSRTLCASTS